MIYDISAYVPLSGGSEALSLEAESEEDAKAKALELGQKIIADIKRRADALDVNSVQPRVNLSDKNFLLTVNGIYLLSYYSKFLPARCVSSWSHRWSRKKYEHVFSYLGSGRYLTLYGDNPKRVIKKLCDDCTQINKPECKDCVARFQCYTSKMLV